VPSATRALVSAPFGYSKTDVHGIISSQPFCRGIKGSSAAGIHEDIAKQRRISNVEIDPTLICREAVPVVLVVGVKAADEGCRIALVNKIA
jgi:hypothetical protein